MMWNHPARFGSALKSDESVQTRAREDDKRVKSQSHDSISRFYFYFPKLRFELLFNIFRNINLEIFASNIDTIERLVPH